MLKQDNFFVGVTLSLVLIVITILVLLPLIPFIYNAFNLGVPAPSLLLLSIVPSVILMRYYLKVLKFGKSGGGALIIVFVAIILYFLLVASKFSSFPTL